MKDPPGSLSRRDLMRRTAIGAGVLAFGPAAQACSSAGSSGGTSASGPKRGGTLTFGRGTGVVNFDPANTIADSDVYTLDKIFEPLYITDPQGKLIPWLVLGHTVSSDAKTWTFTLRPGVKFSDGKPLTADDVVFSVMRCAKDTAGPLSYLDAAIKSMHATGARTFVAELTQPWAPFISDLSVYSNAIVPKDLNGQSAQSFFKKPIGTGPFVIKSWTPGANLTLARNKGYWQPGKPYLDEIQFPVIADENQRVLQLKSGTIDIAGSAPPASVSGLKSASGVSVGLFPGWLCDLLLFNEKIPKFADRHVRRAIAHAIDRKAISTAASFGTAPPAGSFIPPSVQFYDPKTPVLGYDLAAAKAELSQSHFPHGFSTKLLVPSSNAQYAATAQIIQSELQKLNISVAIQSLDDASYHQEFQSFHYEMFLNWSVNDITDPDDMCTFQVDPKAGGSDSYWTSYNNPAAIALVHQGETTQDTAQRAKIYSELQAVVNADAPFIPLDYPPYIFAWRNNVHNFKVIASGAYRLESVWLD